MNKAEDVISEIGILKHQIAMLYKELDEIQNSCEHHYFETGNREVILRDAYLNELECGKCLKVRHDLVEGTI